MVYTGVGGRYRRRPAFDQQYTGKCSSFYQVYHNLLLGANKNFITSMRQVTPIRVLEKKHKSSEIEYLGLFYVIFTWQEIAKQFKNFVVCKFLLQHIKGFDKEGFLENQKAYGLAEFDDLCQTDKINWDLVVKEYNI